MGEVSVRRHAQSDQREASGDDFATSRSLRVLIVTDYYFPGATGSPLHVMEVADQLRTLGCPLEVVRYTGRTGATRRAKWNGLAVHHYSRKDWFSGLRHRLRDFQPDVLYLHGRRSALLTAPARRWRLPAVVEIHSLIGPSSRRLNWITAASGVVSRVLGDRFVTLSERERDDLVTLSRVPANLIDVAYPPVPTAARHAEPRAVRGSDPVVLYTGNMHPYQGIDLLLSAMQIVWAARPDVQLRIAGGTAHEVQRAARGPLDPRVNALGRLPAAMMPALHADSDVLVVPRRDLPVNRTTPRKLGEYLAAGRVVVSTDVGDARKLLEGRGAGLVAHPSPEGLATTLLEALSPGFDSLGRAERAQALTDELFAPETATRRRLEVLAASAAGRPTRITSN